MNIIDLTCNVTGLQNKINGMEFKNVTQFY